jgi:hypothetical protein
MAFTVQAEPPELAALATRHLSIHEAGHGTVWGLLHRERPDLFPLPCFAWIAPPLNGRVAYRGPVATRETVELRCMIAMGGVSAELVEFGQFGKLYEKGDRPAVLRAFREAGISGAQRAAMIEQIQDRALALLKRPEVHAAVREIAELLAAKGTLTDRDILPIIERRTHG